MEAKCSGCARCILVDYGYSNYTVENTEVNCSILLNPDAPFDRFYGEDKRDNFAELCESFVAGEPAYVDVDEQDFKPKLEGDMGWQEYATEYVTEGHIAHIRSN
jgi:hypothetical protein